MTNPLNASSSTAGALMSSAVFEIPHYQREYSWRLEEVSEFWNDLRNSIQRDSYFLGLVILTNSQDEQSTLKSIVDGQQRILTLSLLCIAIYYEAVAKNRRALADRIQADFLRSIDYETDRTDPRVRLSDTRDNATYEYILRNGKTPEDDFEEGSVSWLMCRSFKHLVKSLKQDLSGDSFRRLGEWADFLSNRLYFAVFSHPDAESAYQVFEVVNTRGRELTTADLLKNYILSVTPEDMRETVYNEWQGLSRQFSQEGGNNFVQYIRHVVTLQSGHILPKDLYSYLSGKLTGVYSRPPSPSRLMEILEENITLYLQMIDPSSAGPASPMALKVFEALNSLGVIAVRPIMLAMSRTPDPDAGYDYLLRLVVRRIVVGNLGTGNVERKFGDAAFAIANGDFEEGISLIDDLNPRRDEFAIQLRRRSFNKNVLQFLRRSIIQENTCPAAEGTLHYIWVKQAEDWYEMSEEEGAYWGSTIGNTILSVSERRANGALDWEGFKENMLPSAVPGESTNYFSNIDEWDAHAIERTSNRLAKVGVDVWYR